MSRKNGGGIPPQGARASAIVPAGRRRNQVPQYNPQIHITVEKGDITSHLPLDNKTERALTLFDNELGRFAVALREGKSGSFTLHPDDYAAIMHDLGTGSDIAEAKTGKGQYSVIVYMIGGRIVSTLRVKGSAHHIEEAVLRESGQFVIGALQNKNPESHGTWRISIKDYRTLLEQHSDGFQLFRRITSDKEGTIAVGENPMRLSGRYTMSDFTTVGVESLWKLLQGGSRVVRDLVVREEDIPFLPAEHECETGQLLNYVVLSKGEVIQCLAVENKTDTQLPFFDTTLGKFAVARNELKDGTFLVNQEDFYSLMDDVNQSEGNEKASDTKDSVIVYIDGGRIVSKLQLHGSNHPIDASVLTENDDVVSDFLGSPIFDGTWRITAGTYKLLCEQNTDQFQFFRKVTRHMDGTVTIGDKMKLDGYQDLSSYMKGPIDELVKFLSLTKGAKKVEKEYILRDEDVKALAELAPDKIMLPA